MQPALVLWLPIQISIIIIILKIQIQRQQFYITAKATIITTKSIPKLFQLQPRKRRRIGHPSILKTVRRYASNSNNDSNENNTNGNTGTNNDLSILNEHVLASVQSQIDRTRVLQALSVDEPLARISKTENTPDRKSVV